MRQLILAATIMGLGAGAAFAQPQFYNAVDGTPLNFDDAMEEGRDTEAVKEFMQTGVNIYNENPDVMEHAEEQYNTMCSGCHGHYAEGKIGPGLNDDFWSYEMGKTDVGLFSILYGGASGQMGPMWGSLTLDEMLLAMAWVRHLYTGQPETASWLSPEQREAFTPFKPKGTGGDERS
ncbi:MAG: cytochrome c(L), periplasmic [Paracoccus sp. (in: a-proteobacteria)]|uniref:cytochrome c(L), periplasmic n=1 Tax=Paracoccus sp. TaxID=267 RepID=UPI0026DEF7F0|nr:cytochrome c(L), periplasmic [Paracoccus sp. (in: a-proteobacteria)]MDO5622739.1 cytochrome c(L), periplasmic [Paracoccus sp. (in: a-proteobacteria)]